MNPPATPNPNRIPVWDLPTRLFHWALVLLFAALVYTGKMGKLDLHMKLGQVALALVLFRVIWGFVGNGYARFSSFLASPLAALRYGLTLIGRGSAHYVGHNPLGGHAVIAMLGLILVQGVSGLFTTDDIATDGPLYAKVASRTAGLMTSAHHFVINVLFAVIAVHILASLFYLLVKKENLIDPMINGTKLGQPADAAKPGAGPLVALALFGLCLAGVFGGIAWAAK